MMGLGRAATATQGAAYRASSSPRLLGVTLAVVATAIWSGNFAAARALRHQASPIEIDFWRWLLGLVVLLPFSWRPLRANWPAVRRHWRYLLLTGVIGVSAYNTLIYLAGQTTQAVNLSLLAVASPIFLILITRLVDKELLSWRRTVGLIVGAVGVTILITRGSLSALTQFTIHEGDLIMLLATALFAVYSALARHKPADLGHTTFLVTTIALGVLVLLPIYLTDLAMAGQTGLRGPTLAAIGYLGIGASALAYLAWNRSLALIGTAKAGFVYYLLPIFTGGEAVVFLGAPVTAVQGISLILIVGGIVVGSRT